MRNQVRIIGGRWRASKIVFPAGEAIRPTPDRLRETLFNWLQFSLHGARVLDLFAGSGVLGLEALSRGATGLHSVDTDPAVIAHLGRLKKRFDCDNWRIFQHDYAQFIRAGGGMYDVVFLDPPFQAGFLQTACRLLAGAGMLHAGSLVYGECRAGQAFPEVPGWSLQKQKCAGEVRSVLYGVG